MDYLYRKILNSDSQKKIARLFLRYITLFFTRIGYNYEKTFALYDLKVRVLKELSHDFLRTRKLNPSIDLASKFQITKNDETEYELNVQQVLLNRIIKYLEKEIQDLSELMKEEKNPQKNAEYYRRFMDLESKKKQIDYFKNLINIILVELREFNEMSASPIEYIKRQGSKVIRGFENLTNVEEIKDFDDPEESREHFDDETNPTIGLLHHLSVLSTGEFRNSMLSKEEGNIDKMLAFERHMRDIRGIIGDATKEVSQVIDWHKRPLNDASRLYD